MTPTEEWIEDGRRVGRRVLLYDRVESTNSLALALAGDAEADGLVLVAREQTAGRGQHGRTWLSPAGSSVLLSAVLFPPPALRRPAILTAWAAVSVCETVHELTGLDATIKWPNDVFLGGRKTCGILIEQRQGVVIGIGLNVNQTGEMFHAASLTEATSLAVPTGQEFDCRDVTRRLIGRLDAGFRRLAEGDLEPLEASWRERLGLLGKPVTAECHDGDVRGRLLELTFAGVVLEVTGGALRCLSPEAVRHLRPR
ncbi:MAG TPA: biotin--[acetyl-CoA-carboxylase] ligase [Gemmataceae bacterium]|nr:biotin--[acetyl-CoA-carboxylase] ligase [Gemmataceae bacterium]